MHIEVHSHISEIDAKQWNALLRDNNPFMRHEFLNGLEVSGCVSEQNGWLPLHLAVYSDADKKHLIGVMPLYQKDHSYGEYIFDWSWADAHFRQGLDYYPKLSNAIPFTPATGPRWLVAPDQDHDAICSALIDAALQQLNERQLSSFHSLFLCEEQFDELGQQSLLQRHSTQFHWHNRNYQNFDDFLLRLSSKKRKNIKRERRRVTESEVSYRWLTGDDLDREAADTMYQFYLRTIHYYGAQSYLNKAFYEYLADHFSSHTLFLFAYYNDQIIAGGLYFKSDDTLYGRYWGALNNFHSVHFETCYYQPIEWCIRHGYKNFEAGAQGEHKLARGLEPTKTYSAHYIQHPSFRSAIGDFLIQEQNHIDNYARAMQAHSPFKTEI